MLGKMSWKEFVSWREYNKMDPFGGARLDWVVASVVSTLINIHRNTEKYPNPFPIGDFVMKWGDEVPKNFKPPPPQQKTWQQLKMIGQLCAAAFNMINDSEEEERKKRKRKR